MEKLVLSGSNPPLAVAFSLNILKLPFTWDNSHGETTFELDDGTSTNWPPSIARYLARKYENSNLYGQTIVHRTEVDHWISFSLGPLACKEEFNQSIEYLNRLLEPVTYLVNNVVTLADLFIFEALYKSLKWQSMLEKKEAPLNVNRWYQHLQNLESLAKVLSSLNSSAKSKSSRSSNLPTNSTRKEEGKFIELEGAEIGKVVVRFPPEASGFLHIGHAKAALLNQYYKDAFKGKLVFRFDDTNPAKEKVDFEKVILEDIALLGLTPDRYTHTSDYFDLMLTYCEKLLKDGKAYIDDTDPETMKSQREQRIKSEAWSNSVDQNLKLWQEMLNGSELGQRCCVRARIDMESVNGCLRDPTIYRCKPELHPKTGDKYKVYPTYDFACPIVDSIEDVTHCLRTTEYHDRDEQFYWFIEALDLRKPYIWEYSRLNMTHTLLSKRKLTWFVDQGIVDGWDDPRMPTVRGVLRRGMTVEGLRQFIVAQGSSRSVVVMEWDKIWAFNKKVIDPIAPRYTTILHNDPVVVNVKEAPEQSSKVAKHPKNPEVGEKTVWTGPRVLVDRIDAELFKPQDNVTFINWGNLIIEQVQRDNNGKITSVDARTNLTNTDFKKTLKVTWLAQTEQAQLTPCIGIYLDHLITKPVLGKDEDFKNFIAKDTQKTIKMFGDPELKSIKKSDIIQLQRRGFFICDQEYKPPSIYSGVETPCVLIYVPDGHSKQPLVNLESNKEKTKSGESKSPQDDHLASRIISQADHVRQLKTKKAEKVEIDAAVHTLLKLKSEYKSETGQEWKAPSPPKVGSLPAQQTDIGLNEKITQQGEKVRQLKASKADKKVIETEVKTLLELKAEFKKDTGTDWKPGVVQTPPKQSISEKELSDVSKQDELNEKITQQGEKVRQLKASKADKKVIETEVKTLLELKAEFKKATGTDWKPGVVQTPPKQSISEKELSDVSKQDELNEKITQQGEKVRQLKASKADKKVIETEVKTLLELKAEFKKATGTDWKPGVVQTPPKQANQSILENELSDASKQGELNEKIAQQGDKVRQLKASKSDKKVIETEVKTLLELKAEFKKTTGTDWKPGVVQISPKANQSVSEMESADVSKQDELNEKITQQGEKVRQLKASKADKKVIETEVKTLLELKTEFKKATGTDWKPGVVQTPPKQANQSILENELSDLVSKQGDKVRLLKAEKAEKNQIDSEIQKLLALKKDYKEASGQEWKPKNINSNQEKFSEHDLNNRIIQQGDKVRQLKVQKADKLKIEPEVKILLELKTQYKSASGQDWKPPTPAKTQIDLSNELLLSKIQQQENKLGQLKESKAEKAQIDAVLEILLSLKDEYRTFNDPSSPGRSTNKNKMAPKKQIKDKSQPKPIEKSSSGEKKQTRLGLEAKKEDNLPEWYSQVITKGELISYYNVSGCYILRPWAFSIWKHIKNFIDQEIEKLGVEECYFPMFVSKGVLEKEKEHISDFSPEVAWVTHSGDSEMAEPVAIRPTSETGMYPAFADWIQSHRDLPIRLNQWNNVVRWEFKHPQPFLRTREFLWQEGHTAWAKQSEAEEEVTTILDIYERVYSELLAIPVIKGRKTEKEKFAGGDYTTTTEAFIAASGRAIQGATSHHLGQNFSRMFEITYEDPETQKEQYVYQNSWGMTTRVIGVMIMVHADNQGLVLPPKVASKQVVVVPCGITVNLSQPARQALFDACRQLKQNLIDLGIRVECDLRDNYSPGWKFNHWELKGVPLRIELGPKDLEKKQMVAVRRDTGEKLIIPDKDLSEVCKLLEKIQANLLDKATKELDSHLKICRNWGDFCKELDQKNIILAPFCEAIPCEEKIKKDSTRDEEADSGAPSMGAKSLCIPFKQPAKIEATDQCIHPDCKEKAKSYTLFGRSY